VRSSRDDARRAGRLLGSKVDNAARYLRTPRYRWLDRVGEIAIIITDDTQVDEINVAGKCLADGIIDHG
jgi:hypothetical protein